MASDFFCLKIFGLKPAGWHLLDLLFHSLNALLVSMLLSLLLQGGNQKWRTRLSILGGIIFAVHPVALLTGAWIACRADLLASFFSLLSLLSFLSALKNAKRDWLKLAAAFCIALPGFACKETAFVFPALALVMAFCFAPSESFRKRIFDSALVLVLAALSLAAFLMVRLKLFGGFGGYEQVEFSLAWLWPRLAYHLPRVLEKSLRDYLTWHLPAQSLAAQLLIWPYLALAIICLRAVLRAPRFLLAGLAWMFITLMPYWNLSNMFAYGEARWLYLGLASLPLALMGAVSKVKSAKIRGLALALVAVVLVSLVKTSWTELHKFQERSNQYEKVKQQVSKVIPLDDAKSHAARVYVYGLPFDFYYLDAMLKVYYPQWLDRIIVPAEIPAIAWVRHGVLQQYQANRPIYPKVEVAYDDGQFAVVSATPPADLIEAPVRDPLAAVLEWKRNKLADITSELVQLYHERGFMQMSWANPAQLKRFPTYSFRKRNYPLDWKLSPRLKLLTPYHRGELYTFVSKTDDPYLVSPSLNFLAISTGELGFEMKVMAKKYLAPQERDGCFFWMTNQDRDWQPLQKICFPIQADGQFHSCRIHLDHNLYWLRSSTITRVRLDPVSFPAWFQIEAVDFHPLHYQE